MISNIRRFIRKGGADDEGQALVEYALILMLIAFVAFAALDVIGASVVGALTDAASGFGGA